MNKFILFLGAVLIGSTSFGQAPCQADFTYLTTGGTVDFTNTSTGSNLSYNWSFGDGSTSNQMNPSNTYTVSGGYTVCLTVYSQDSLGGFCQDQYCDSIWVTADTNGVNCQADFTYSMNGSLVDFTNTSIGSNLGYTWSFGDGTTSSQMNPSNAYGGGQYNVCLTIYSLDSLGTCQDIHCDSIWVPQDTLGGCNLNANVSVNGNDMIVGTNNSTGAMIYYQWEVYDAVWNSLYTTSSTNLSYGPVANGNYNVCLTAYDSLQQVCDSICYSITALDSVNSIFENGNIVEFSIYPNPAKDQVNIKVDAASVQQMVIVDLTGRKMDAIQIESDITTIDLMNYPNGLYLIHALDHSGRRLNSAKFFKE